MHQTQGKYSSKDWKPTAQQQTNRTKSRAEHSAEEGPNIFLKLVTTERVNQNLFPFSHRSVRSDNTGFCVLHSGKVCVGLPIHMTHWVSAFSIMIGFLSGPVFTAVET